MARFTTDGFVRAIMGRGFPWGTLAINIAGSFILGMLIGLTLHYHIAPGVYLIIGTGFCGGFTTFSTASFEAVRLIEERRPLAVICQLLGNAGLAFSAAALGIWIA